MYKRKIETTFVLFLIPIISLLAFNKVDGNSNTKSFKLMNMNENNFKNEISQSNLDSNSYSVVIDIFRKTTYKKYSYRIVDNKFEAVKFVLNKQPEIFFSKKLSSEEAKEFEQYLRSFPLGKIKEEYINNGVKGEYHLEYDITIGEKHKSVLVYFEHQDDLVELYKRVSDFVPLKERILYYGE